jgi:hypothetical protein
MLFHIPQKEGREKYTEQVGLALFLYSGGAQFKALYPGSGFSLFSSVPSRKCQDSASIKPQPLPSKCFHIIILPFDAL